MREVVDHVENALNAFGLDTDNIPRAHISSIAQEIIRMQEERQVANVGVDIFDIANRLGIDLGPNARRLGNNSRARRLDPNLPLLQLFWQTFLPWNEM